LVRPRTGDPGTIPAEPDSLPRSAELAKREMTRSRSSGAGRGTEELCSIAVG
jgi:hypothetical protein